MTNRVDPLNIANNMNKVQRTVQNLHTQNLDFTRVFDQAIVGSVASTSEWNPNYKDKKIKDNKSFVDAKEYFKKSQDVLVAQLGPNVPVPASALTKDTVPIQAVFNRLIANLSDISDQERRVNVLIEAFIRGEVSEDEVVLETAKLNLMMSMITTLIQTGVQTFKEILQIPV